MYRLGHADCVVTTEQAPLKNEGGDGRQDADRVSDAASQKEEQHLVSTKKQPVKSTDGEVVADGECNVVVNEWETDESDFNSSKVRSPPYISPRYIADSDQEVSQ